MKFFSLDGVKDTVHLLFTAAKVAIVGFLGKVCNTMIEIVNNIMGENADTAAVDSVITNGYVEARHDAKAMVNIVEEAVDKFVDVVFTYDTADPELYEAELAGEI